ncbi:olfactory receptor 1009-like [Bufo gargarizans]|uniref:olfactory receptor 1009-like n=1 Tax=Bufo gargarizans TaxID=30331 RepID=UPI001CF2DCED|nr:olfactory receptor 1009-like [Bufo gargarizans]
MEDSPVCTSIQQQFLEPLQFIISSLHYTQKKLLISGDLQPGAHIEYRLDEETKWIWKQDVLIQSRIRNVWKPMKSNLTVVVEFVLLGFHTGPQLRIFLFSLLLVVYCGEITGNILIIILVSTSKNLHTPMYFLISQLSISDILLPTDIVPNMLYILLNNEGIITFTGCITQLYFFCVFEVFECLLLTVMSYDRYVAICNPLHYSSIMTRGHCVKLICICWVAAFTLVLIYVITTSMLKFCKPNILDHFFCDYVPLLEKACSDTFIVKIQVIIVSIPVVIIPSIIIIASYVNIIVNILRIPSSTGRQKAFSTCSSHLIVVSIFYWTLYSVYVFPTKGQTSTINKILSLLYTVFIPVVNPIIYSLRNKDIVNALNETFKSEDAGSKCSSVVWKAGERECRTFGDTVSVIYLVQCPCSRQYIGRTKRALRVRISEHIANIKKGYLKHSLSRHFKEAHGQDPTGLTFVALEKIDKHWRGGNHIERMSRAESKQIFNFGSMIPVGLNAELEIFGFL